MAANDFQVAGGHYKTSSGMQHWDLVELYGLGYLEGCATKYVTRWRKKNGKVDLEKGRHFAIKLQEMFEQGTRLPRGTAPVEVLERFAVDNQLDDCERFLVTKLARWRTTQDLEQIIAAFDHLLSSP